jgi:hypothetical protein
MLEAHMLGDRGRREKGDRGEKFATFCFYH